MPGRGGRATSALVEEGGLHACGGKFARASTNAQRRQPAMAAKMDALLDQHYIGGALVPPAQGRYLDVIDPSEERVWGRSAAGTAEVYETPNAPVMGPRACGARTRACVAVC